MTQSVSTKRWRLAIALGLPAVVALALMIPRVARAHFGLLDDPASLSVANQVEAGEWRIGDDVTFGRFRPAYWLYFTALNRMVGGSPHLHFAANAFLLATTTGLLSYLARRVTGSDWVGLFAGLAFTLGGPIVEVAFTLSKPELQQSLLIIAWVLLAGALRPDRAGLKVASLASASILAMLACVTKETGVLLLPLSVLLLVRVMVLTSPDTAVQARQIVGRLGMLGTAALAVAGTVLLAALAAPDTFTAAGPQAGFGLKPLLVGVRAWADWLARDYLYIIPLALAWLVLCAGRRGAGPSFGVLVDCALWALVWLVPYISYRFTPEYYLLPMSLGASLAAGVLLWDDLKALKSATPVRRGPVILLLMTGGVLFLLTLPTNASNGAIQLAVDEANSEMVDLVAEVLPAGATLLVNFDESYEYVRQLGPMLNQLKDRADVNVVGSTSPFPPAVTRESDLYVVSPILENQPYPTVRLGVDEHTARAWEDGLQDELGPRLELIGEVRSNAPLAMVDSLRLFCVLLPQVDYCQVPNAPLDTRRFAAGWRLYAVQPLEG